MFYWRKQTFILFVTIIVSAVLSGCESKTRSTKLFNIDSLVSEQVILLAARKPQLNKEAVLGNSADKNEYVPDSLAWSKELDIFRQLDAMNKSINKTKYLIDDGLYDPGSNLTVKAFTSLEPLPVRSMRIFYDTDIRAPRKI